MSVQVWIDSKNSQPYRITSESGKLVLPKIIIEQTDEHQPVASIIAIRARFVGDAVGVEFLQGAYGGTGELKRFEKPYTLSQPIEIPPYTVQLKSRKNLPAGQYVMRAEVTALEPLPFPGAKRGNDLVFVIERLIEVPVDLESSCSIQCRWHHQELIVGSNDAVLEIEIENFPRGGKLFVSVFDPDQVQIPSLIDAINRSLASQGAVQTSDNDRNSTVFRQNIALSYDHNDKGEAIRIAPLQVNLRVAVLRQKAENQIEEVTCISLIGELALKVDFVENMFPGYPILDLGTSTTFALMYFFRLKTGSLPVEQESNIRRTVQSWTTRCDGLYGMPEWRMVLAGAARLLGEGSRASADPVVGLSNFLRLNPALPDKSDTAIHQLIRALELSAMSPNLSVEFQLSWRRELAEMYSRTFRRFPLEQQCLVSVELDEASKSDDLNEFLTKPIPSTVQVIGVRPLALEIGGVAEKSRKNASVSNPLALISQFHSSPKNYYLLLGHQGATVPISIGDQITQVSPRAFLVAALKRLRERMENFRNQSSRLPKKRFSKIVLPFPTSAPLSVRQILLDAAKEAGFDRPIADLDEALSAIVFYLVNPFGADIEMGLESFRASCRPVPRGDLPPVEWKQNVLLVDVGGGTTDIALIEVKLEDAQAKGGGDGSRGRYYRLVPKLLGATGKGQLAGNLISLGVFHEIKKRIADAVLTAMTSVGRPSQVVSSNASTSRTALDTPSNLSRLLNLLNNIPAALSSSDKSYLPGAITELYQSYSLWESKGQHASAYQFVSDILPTAWRQLDAPEARSEAARTFYRLWEIAEDAKIRVFGDSQPNATRTATITKQQIAELLNIEMADADRLGIADVSLSEDDFDTAIAIPLKQIAKLSVDLTTVRLPRAEDGTQILDRIVLTGQTCRLARVRGTIRQGFLEQTVSPKSKLRWDPDCLTFEGDHAKRAAALGAAYAQLLREDRVPPNADSPLNGNVLDIDIQNLFFFLQSGFYVLHPGIAGGKKTMLSPGEPFREFDDNGVGRLRSSWEVPTEMIKVERFDYITNDGVPWGHFDCGILAEQLGMSLRAFQENVRYSIEADHRLIVSILFCMGSERHYELPTGGEYLNLPRTLREMNILPNLNTPENSKSNQDDWCSILKGWRIGVNVKSGFGNHNLIQFGDLLFNRTMRHLVDGKISVGTDTVELPPCPDSGIDKFYIHSPDPQRDWTQIGELKRPLSKTGRAMGCRAVLDEAGDLRLILGDLPLFFASHDEALQDGGVVLRKPLTSPDHAPDDLKDPFCGRH